MKPDDLPSEICTALMRIGAAVTSGFDRHFAPHGLTHAQFRTLLAVHAAGPAGVAPSVLAGQLFLERTTVTAISTRLVDRGWLERTPGENRRTLRLRLTPEGQRLLHALTPRASELAAHTLRTVPEPELRQMCAGLQATERALRAGIQPEGV